MFEALPEVNLRIVTGTAPVDFDRDEVDVAVRFGRGSAESVVSDELFGEVVGPVASPSFIRTHHLRRPVDLTRVRLLHDESMRRVGRPSTWTEWLRAAGAPAVEISEGTRFDDSHLTLQAACDGQGVALGRLAYAVHDLAHGRLVLPFSRVIELDLHYHLLVPETRAAEPLIAGFRRWLLREAQEFRSVLSDHARAA